MDVNSSKILFVKGRLENARKEHFAHLVAHGEVPGKAYVIAGYSKNGCHQSARRLLMEPEVKRRIADLQELIAKPSTERAIEKAALNKHWVVSRLMELTERCMQHAPVLDSRGKPVLVQTPTGDIAAAYKFDAAGANKALELLGKELGLFVERKEVGKPGEFEALNDDELDRTIRQLATNLEAATRPRAGNAPVPPAEGSGGDQLH